MFANQVVTSKAVINLNQAGFFFMTKKLRQKFKYIENETSF